jgi:dihydrolipoamide dehydrogenase
VEEYDLVIIGAGPAGYVAGLRAAQRGLKTVVVEKDYVGGVCLNRGCIPTKTLLESARHLNAIKMAGEFGIKVGNFEIDAVKIWQRKNQVVENLRRGIDYLFKARAVNFLKGRAKLTGKNLVEVKTGSGISNLEAKNIILATGSSPFELPGIKFDHERILSSDDILDLNRIPKSLIIVGGGVIGCEFASLFSSLGTKITIVELLKNLLPQEDPEISKTLETNFKKKGIKVMTDTKLESIAPSENGIEANFSESTKIESDLILICVGRKPNTENLGLKKVEVEAEVKGGWIKVDDYLRTNLPNIYAIGDVTGKILLAHVASHQGEITAENILGSNKVIDYSCVPNCIFTFPEIASVGINETRAKELGLDYGTGKFPFRALGKSHTAGEVEGFVKLLIDKHNDTILGAHIIGPQAVGLIAELSLAMKNKLKLNQITDTIHAHPTFSEIIPEAVFTYFNLPLHTV